MYQVYRYDIASYLYCCRLLLWWNVATGKTTLHVMNEPFQYAALQRRSGTAAEFPKEGRCGLAIPTVCTNDTSAVATLRLR